jgi:hypothetical protein
MGSASSVDTLLADLASKQVWTLLLVVALLGALGGLVQYVVARDPANPAGRPGISAVVGVIGALGALWADTSKTGGALIGQSLLAGFFGRAVIAALQARITAAVEKERRERATAVARDSLALLERRALPGKTEAPVVSEGEIAGLRARLADAERSRPAEAQP